MSLAPSALASTSGAAGPKSRSVDINEDGVVQYDEFLRWSLPQSQTPGPNLPAAPCIFWYIHRPHRYDRVNHDNPCQAHVCTTQLHGPMFGGVTQVLSYKLESTPMSRMHSGFLLALPLLSRMN